MEANKFLKEIAKIQQSSLNQSEKKKDGNFQNLLTYRANYGNNILKDT